MSNSQITVTIFPAVYVSRAGFRPALRISTHNGIKSRMSGSVARRGADGVESSRIIATAESHIAAFRAVADCIARDNSGARFVIGTR